MGPLGGTNREKGGNGWFQVADGAKTVWRRNGGEKPEVTKDLQ